MNKWKKEKNQVSSTCQKIMTTKKIKDSVEKENGFWTEHCERYTRVKRSLVTFELFDSVKQNRFLFQQFRAQMFRYRTIQKISFTSDKKIN